MSTLTCPHCPTTFTRDGSMRRHVLKFHESTPPVADPLPNTCSECKKTFATKHTLQRHLPVCKKDIGNLQCKFCLKTFLYSSSKCRHQKSCQEKSVAVAAVPEESTTDPGPSTSIQTQNNIQTQNKYELFDVYNIEKQITAGF